MDSIPDTGRSTMDFMSNYNNGPLSLDPIASERLKSLRHLGSEVLLQSKNYG